MSMVEDFVKKNKKPPMPTMPVVKESVTREDYANLEAILKTHIGDSLLQVVRQWGLEFAGATETEAVFTRKDGCTVALMPNEQFQVWNPGGEEGYYDGEGYLELIQW